MTVLTDFTPLDLHGKPRPLSEFEGKVVLVVNTASRCGKAPQFEGLESLFQEFQEQGLVVLGFPSNQFAQELGKADAIEEFCQVNYGVTFPMFAKVRLNGWRADPLYKWLKKTSPGGDTGRVTWNFAKFLIGRDGRVVGRYSPDVLPQELRVSIFELAHK